MSHAISALMIKQNFIISFLLEAISFLLWVKREKRVYKHITTNADKVYRHTFELAIPAMVFIMSFAKQFPRNGKGYEFIWNVKIKLN